MNSNVNKRYDNISILRVIAVLSIFIAHLFQKMNVQGHLRKFTNLGALGVELFLVISGFLAAMYFVKQRKHNIIKYYSKRIIRIMPLYYFIILYYFLLILFFFNGDFPKDPTNLGWFRYIFAFAGNIKSGTSWFDFWTNLGATWTIFVFLTFYLLFPFIAKIVKGFYSSVAFFIVSLLMRYVLEYKNYNYMHSLQYFCFFALGVMAYYSIIQNKRKHLYIFIALLLLLNLFLKATILEFNDLIISSLCFTILLVSTADYKIKNNNINKCISLIDKYSYTIYLGQGIFFYENYGLIDIFGKNLNKPLIFIISVLGTVIVCYIIYNLIEKPIQKIGIKAINKYL